jgi:polysaccharide export outer membrane protein
VFVTGEVNQPGKFTFEQIPDLWALINEAGGITDLADLTRVTIVRGGEREGQVEVVNVARAISSGTLSSLPQIYRFDTIELPRNTLGLPGRELANNEDISNVVYVVGAVTRPGAVTFEDNTDILEAIAMAGGPLENADLSDARLITIDGRYGQTMQIDLNKYSKSGKPARYVLRKEDTIYLPSRPDGGFFQRNITTIVAALGAVTSFLLIYDQLKPADNPTGTN